MKPVADIVSDETTQSFVEQQLTILSNLDCRPTLKAWVLKMEKNVKIEL
jgi:hypothetical protein